MSLLRLTVAVTFAWWASKIRPPTWLTVGILQLHSDTVLELNQMQRKLIWPPVVILVARLMIQSQLSV